MIIDGYQNWLQDVFYRHNYNNIKLIQIHYSQLIHVLQFLKQPNSNLLHTLYFYYSSLSYMKHQIYNSNQPKFNPIQTQIQPNSNLLQESQSKSPHNLLHSQTNSRHSNHQQQVKSLQQEAIGVQQQNPQNIPKQKKKNSMTLANYFSFVDVFSVSPSFYHEKNQKFSTILGGIFGFCAILISAYLAATNPNNLLTNINLVYMTQQTAGFSNALSLTNYPISIDFYISNGTTNYIKTKFYNNITVNFICRSRTSALVITDIVYPSVSNCDSEYCMPSNFTCDVYSLQSGEARFIVVTATTCLSTDTSCNYTYFTTTYPTLTSPIFFQINFINNVPSLTNPNFNSINQLVFAYSPWTSFTTYNFTVFKQSFKTSDQLSGILNRMNVKVYGMKREAVDYISDRLPATTTYTAAKNTQGGNIFTNIYFFPSNNVILLSQNFINLTGILAYYCSVLGVLSYIISLILSNYSENILKINIGRYINYSTNNHQIASFKESSLKTMLAGLLYYQSLAKRYPNCIKNYFKSHFSLIKSTTEKMTIDYLLGQIQKINNVDLSKKLQIVKPILDENELQNDESSGLKKQQIQQLKIYIQEHFSKKFLSKQQIDAFVKWVEMNNYDLNESKAMADQVFQKDSFSNPIYTANLLGEYEKFKQQFCPIQKDNDIVIQKISEKDRIGMDSEIKLEMSNQFKHSEQNSSMMGTKQLNNKQTRIVKSKYGTALKYEKKQEYENEF